MRGHFFVLPVAASSMLGVEASVIDTSAHGQRAEPSGGTSADTRTVIRRHGAGTVDWELEQLDSSFLLAEGLLSAERWCGPGRCQSRLHFLLDQANPNRNPATHSAGRREYSSMTRTRLVSVLLLALGLGFLLAVTVACAVIARPGPWDYSRVVVLCVSFSAGGAWCTAQRVARLQRRGAVSDVLPSGWCWFSAPPRAPAASGRSRRSEASQLCVFGPGLPFWAPMPLCPGPRSATFIGLSGRDMEGA